MARGAPDAGLQAAYRALAAGDLAAAARAAEARREAEPDDAFAWHLLGVARMKEGRAAEARQLLERAAELDTGQAMMQLDLGNARLATEDAEGARAAFAQAARLRPGWAAAHYNGGVAARKGGDLLGAARAFAAAARSDAREYAAMQACVECVAEHVRAGRAPEPAAIPTPAAMPFSIVFCSPDAARLEAARARLSQLGGEAELLPMLAPRSLAAAYNEAARRARHEHVLFVHDDVEFISPAPLAFLSAALREADVVGLAGSERAAGPAVLWSGHPGLHGWVSYPAPQGDGLEAAPLSLRRGVVPAMQTLDGLAIACRREVALDVGFDAETFDAFHFYDLDFSIRAQRAGWRLAVTTEVLVVHASRGGFGAEWQRYRERFQRKFPELDAPAGAPHWYAAPLPDASALRAFYSLLGEAGRAQDP
jgi:tetratricopeptide (TPR) repeat protein